MELFNREEELVNSFTERSNDFLKSLLHKSVSKYFLVHEFDSYFGVADVVLGTFKSGVGQRRSRDPINPNWIAPLASMKRGTKLSIENFCQSFGLSKNSAVKRLDEYEHAGFLQRREDNIFHVVKEYEPVADLVISVEAKLKDWRKALTQAQRYKRFSDFAFVLLDGTRTSAAIANLEMFKFHNIGLVSLTENKLQFHFVPQQNERKKNENYLRINEVAYECFTSMKTAY